MINSIEEALAILQIKNVSSINEIKVAYRKLAFLHHPDRGGRPEDFVKLRAAYEILIANFSKIPVTEEPFDIPVPDDLQRIISQIVNSYKEIHSKTIKGIRQIFSSYKNIYLNEIERAFPKELEGLSKNKEFEIELDSALKDVLSQANLELKNITKEYNNWLSNSFKETYNSLCSWQLFLLSKHFSGFLFLFIFLVYVFPSSSSPVYLIPYGSGLLLISYLLFLWSVKQRLIFEEPNDLIISSAQVNILLANISLKVQDCQGMISHSIETLALWGIFFGHPYLAVLGIGIKIWDKISGAEEKNRKKIKKLHRDLIQGVTNIIDQMERDFISYFSGEMEKFSNDLQSNIVGSYKETSENIVKLVCLDFRAKTDLYEKSSIKVLSENSSFQYFLCIFFISLVGIDSLIFFADPQLFQSFNSKFVWFSGPIDVLVYSLFLFLSNFSLILIGLIFNIINRRRVGIFGVFLTLGVFFSGMIGYYFFFEQIFRL